MKIILKKPIVGYRREADCDVQNWDSPIKHADKGDELRVLIHNPTHFICDSLYHPGTHIIVFPTQCDEVFVETLPEDEHDIEKYYNVYEDKSKADIEDDPFYRAFNSEYDD